MREHEVPTHVQAEDRVLLWLTFPQIVAVVAVCAVSYGAYRYFPLGPSEFKLAVAVLLGVLGIAMTVGKVGGRGLPLVAADLLKFNLKARRYAGSPSQLVVSEPPPAPEARPDPLRLLAMRAASGLTNAAGVVRRRAPTSSERRGTKTEIDIDIETPPESKLYPHRLIRGALFGLGRTLRAAGPKPPAPREPQSTGTESLSESKPCRHRLIRGAMSGLGRTLRAAGPKAPAPREPQSTGTESHPESKPCRHRLIRGAMSGLVRTLRAARRRGSPPFRPHMGFGKRRPNLDANAVNPHRREGGDGDKNPKARGNRNRGPRRLSMALAALALAVLTIPAVALADGPWSEDAWRLEEIGYPPPEPVPGRRLYLEEINVTGTLAMVTVRAATDVKLDVRSYGGDSGRVLTFFVHDLMEQGESERFGLSLDGPGPSFTFAWQDGLGQTGALALKGRQLPHPMPAVEGKICSLQLDNLSWTPGTLSGVIVSRCADELYEQVSLPVSSGHHQQSVEAVLPAAVTGVNGTVRVSAGGSSVSVPFVQDGETRFTIPVSAGEAVNEIAMDAALTAALNVPLPPVLDTTHHPARTDVHRRTVSLSCGKYSVSRTVSIRIHHPGHVRAEVVSRGALARTRTGTVALTTSLASDAAYRALALPEPTPTPVKAKHRPLTDDETRELFNRDDRREFP